MADLCGDRNSDASRTLLDGVEVPQHRRIEPRRHRYHNSLVDFPTGGRREEATQRLDLIKSQRERERERERWGCHASIAGSASAILRVRTRVKLFFFCLFIHTVYSHSKLRNQGPSAASRVR